MLALQPNLPPVILGPFVLSVPEEQLTVGALNVSDLNGDNVTWAILPSPDGALFSVFGGLLQFVATPNFEQPGDQDSDNVYQITVSATDDGGLFDTRNLTITVTNVCYKAPVSFSLFV